GGGTGAPDEAGWAGAAADDDRVDQGTWVADEGTWVDDEGEWVDDEGEWVADEGGWVDDGDWVDDDDEVVYVPDEPGLLRRGAAIGAVFALVVVVVVGAGALWVRGKLDPSGPKDPVSFVIPEEATTAQIANLLEDRGIISDATVF